MQGLVPGPVELSVSSEETVRHVEDVLQAYQDSRPLLVESETGAGKVDERGSRGDAAPVIRNLLRPL